MCCWFTLAILCQEQGSKDATRDHNRQSSLDHHDRPRYRTWTHPSRPLTSQYGQLTRAINPFTVKVWSRLPVRAHQYHRAQSRPPFGSSGTPHHVPHATSYGLPLSALCLDSPLRRQQCAYLWGVRGGGDFTNDVMPHKCTTRRAGRGGNGTE